MNILILAAGTRNKIVQYFVRTFNGVGTVVATDASLLGPAIYDADKYYIVPAITEEGYIVGVKNIIGSIYQEIAIKRLVNCESCTNISLKSLRAANQTALWGEGLTDTVVWFCLEIRESGG